MVLDIKYDTDPVLHTPTTTVSDFDKELQQIVCDMTDTVIAYKGLGLAAPQVGIGKSIIVLVFAPYILINPEIVSVLGNQVGSEGCLSFPGLYLDISRSTSITVNYQNVTGVNETRIFTGLSARCIQHEVDHLNGIVFTKRAKQMTVLLALKRLKHK